MLFWISAVIRAAPYALASLVYLRKLLDPPAPPPIPAGEPYDPPFNGGQCLNKTYLATFTGNQRGVPYTRTVGWSNGKLVEIGFYNVGDRFGSGFELKIQKADGTFDFPRTSTLDYGDEPTPYNVSIAVTSGGSDDCGDIPNPNPPPAIPPDGIADNDDPDIFNNSTTVNIGSSLSTQLSIGGAITGIRAAIAAAVAAAAAAGNALGAIGAVANAVGAIGDAIGEIAKVLDKLEEREREKEKEEEDKKDTLRYDFGSISKDGFLRLYPNPNIQKYKAEQLDLNILSIPIGYGRFFGKNSPNFYRFKSLGYIAFVSPTFGILEYKQIEFSRMSFIIPDDAIGFYYHLGLDGSIAGNCFGFYTQRKA